MCDDFTYFIFVFLLFGIIALSVLPHLYVYKFFLYSKGYNSFDSLENLLKYKGGV